MARWLLWYVGIFFCLQPVVVAAQNGSLFAGKQSISALFVPAPQASGGGGGSLFQGKKSTFFAPAPNRAVPKRAAASRTPPKTLPRAGLPRSITALLDLIAVAEAGPKGFDAVQYGAVIKPPAPPTHLTIGQIYDWIDATPGQPHAIGRYQFIPKTLRALVKRKGYAHETPFSPQVQDQLALMLLKDAGITEFLSGTKTRRAFMKRLARIWAGLPLPTGKSYYQGYAGNKASISWARFETGMAKIFPVSQVQ